MLHRVKKVEYIGGYQLKLQFTNGKFKVVDLEGMLRNAKNMFLQLKDLEYFKKVACDGYSICWPNGIDFCPDVLYKSGKDVPAEKIRCSKKTHIKRKRSTKLLR